MRFKNTPVIQDYKDGVLVKHHAFPNFPKPEEVLQNTTIDEYIWKSGDRYSALAFRFYGDVRLWWVIAWFNKTPLESSLQSGDIIVIPRNVDYIVSLF